MTCLRLSGNDFFAFTFNISNITGGIIMQGAITVDRIDNTMTFQINICCAYGMTGDVTGLQGRTFNVIGFVDLGLNGLAKAKDTIGMRAVVDDDIIAKQVIEVDTSFYSDLIRIDFTSIA